MATKAGVGERARRRADEDDERARAAVARARRGAGLSHDAVGAACGISGSAEWRIERGITKTVDIRTLACIGAVVGLDVRPRVYPAGDPLRDVGQLRLLERLRQRLHPDLGWRTEVPLPINRDLRAWDAVIGGNGWVIAVEAETVLDDLQAVQRRIALKQRDGRIDHVIVLVGDTMRNRRMLDGAPGAFPECHRDSRATLRDLGAGRDPGCSSIVLR